MESVNSASKVLLTAKPSFAFGERCKLPLARRASGSLSLASPRESNQREGDPGVSLSGLLPCEFASVLRGLLNAHPCTCSKLARIVRASLRPFLRTLAATQGPHWAASCRRSNARNLVVQGWTDSWIQGAVRGAEHRRRGGNSPQGRGDGSPRLRSSTGMCCLSNPVTPRSAGDFDSQEANQNIASGA